MSEQSTGGTTSASGGRGGTAGSGGASGWSASGGAGGVSSSGGERGTGGGNGGSVGGTGGVAGRGGAPGTGGRTTSSGGDGGGGTGSGGQSGGNDAAASGLTLTGLKIEANTKNVLSCFVSWKTDQAASSVVQFGESGYDWEISDTKAVTDHKVVVIGMRAAKSYMIKAISTAGSASGSAEGKFTTGALPVTVPVAKVTINDTTKSQPGWTIMNIQKGDGTATAQSKHPATAVMYDADGQPVWYYVDGDTVDRGGAIPVEVTDKGVLIGSVLDSSATSKQPPREVGFAGNTLWECGTPNCNGNGNITHHASKLPNGNYIVNRDVTTGGLTSPVFEEISPDLKVVWSLDFRKLVPPPSGATGDWCHGNSVTVDIDKNEVYGNCRFIGLIKATYKNPSLVWHLPASYGAKGMGSLTFSPTSSQYSDTHDPEIHDDGTILFFDNGGWSGVVGEEGNPRGYRSRAIEYKIDETAKTATLVWEFPGSFAVDDWYKTKFYLPFWGDADRLANGNVLITAGVRGASAESRIFEVTKQDGKVVWEFRLPVDFGVYRSERLSPPPLVHPVAK